MAKALVGFVGGDPRLLDDNQRLRRRVAELEALVLRLSQENDRLVAAQAAEAAELFSRDDELQPV